MEYVPYRKNDGLALRDAPIHGYFAGHGYASVRVDIRGSGDSDGILEDEYLPLEQTDGVEVIKWLAAQPWCTGKVGIIGKSWGGFNGLQIAAHSPAGARRGDQRRLDRRPLRRRRPLHGRLPAGLEHAAVGLGHARLQRPPARTRPSSARRGGRSWLDRMEQHAAVRRGVGLPPAPRRVLEAGLGLRGLLGDHAARSTWSAAGPTPTATRSCGSSRATPGRARA